MSFRSRFTGVEYENKELMKYVTLKQGKEVLMQDTIKELTLVEEALAVLGTASENSTMRVLGYIESVINSALTSMFDGSHYAVKVTKYLHGDKHPHIKVSLVETKPGGKQLDLNLRLQTGDGISQLISFLFTLCLIELRGARPILILDEVLKGFHASIIPDVMNIITIFAENGFQFVMIEYDFELEKIYDVTQVKGISYITPRERENIASDSEVLKLDSTISGLSL